MRGRVDALLHVIGYVVIGKTVEMLGDIVTAAPDLGCMVPSSGSGLSNFTRTRKECKYVCTAISAPDT